MTGLLAVVSFAASIVPVRAQTAVVVEYYHVDALGSLRAVTDQSQAVIERHDYAAFGEEIPPPGIVESKVRFTGKEHDAETGLDYFGARYYSNWTGRFTTVDPLVPIGSAVRDPQLWNRYAYVRNNPLRYSDPDGRCIEDLCIGEIALAIGVSKAAVASFAAASAAAVVVWNQRQEITSSMMELGAAAGSTIQALVSHSSSRVLPASKERSILDGIDRTGKLHGDIPDHVPDTWSREQLEDVKSSLETSIKTRQDEQINKGEDGAHRDRLREERDLLRQVDRKLRDMK